MTSLGRTRQSRTVATLGAVVLFGVALPALAHDDSTTRQKIEARLVKARITAEGQIDVNVKNGSVVLTGAVTTVAAQHDAERLARKEAKFVENRVQVIPAPRPDADIVKDVRREILSNPRLTAFDSIDFGVDQGNVVLSGSVLWGDRRDYIENVISRISGVRSVTNEIGIQDASPFDARLRSQIYSRIYGGAGAVLPGAGERADAPVRIVVDHGKVLLTGYVGSEAERALVGVAARNTLAFDVDNRVKLDGEPPAVDNQPKTTGPGVEI
jgi:osmotically-inducible protein OsmY